MKKGIFILFVVLISIKHSAQSIHWQRHTDAAWETVKPAPHPGGEIISQMCQSIRGYKNL